MLRSRISIHAIGKLTSDVNLYIAQSGPSVMIDRGYLNIRKSDALSFSNLKDRKEGLEHQTNSGWQKIIRALSIRNVHALMLGKKNKFSHLNFIELSFFVI